MTFIASQRPEKNLFPTPGSFDFYKGLQMMNFIATEIHKGFSPLWNETITPEFRKQTTDRLEKRFDFLCEHLRSGNFLLGTTFSIADAYLFTVLNWCHYVKVDLTKWPVLMGYVEKVRSRPSIKETIAAEGLNK